MSPKKDVDKIIEAARISQAVSRRLLSHELDEAVKITERILPGTKINLDNWDRSGLSQINANTLTEFAEYAIKRDLASGKDKL